MSSSHSATLWITELKDGNSEAARKLWERYVIPLTELARNRLGDAPKAIADEEDVAASVFLSLCRGAQAGRFKNIQSRDELWMLLLVITKQKVVDHIRRELAQKRGGGQVRTEATLMNNNRSSGDKSFTLDHFASEGPTPEFVMMLEEQYDRLLGLLRDDKLRRITMARIEGYTVREIAGQLQLTTRSIERKLQLIRESWSRELGS